MYEITKSGWVGYDLDHSLAQYHKKQFPEIGEPIPKSVERLKNIMIIGYEVRIFTARANDVYKTLYENGLEHLIGEGYAEIVEIDKDQRRRIGDWTKEVFGFRLRATNMKDFNTICIYDDRGVPLEPGTGELLGPDYPLREQ